MKSKYSSIRLIIALLSFLVFFLVAFQSCAAGMYNAMSNNGEISGSVGFLCALSFAVAGIIELVYKHSEKRAPFVVVCGLYWLIFFFSRIGAGSFTDLKVWGYLAYIFGAFNLISSAQTSKQLKISAVVSVIYLILGVV